MMDRQFYFGVVEDRNCPLKLGRCRVRVVGLHSENRTELPTEDLPWAIPLQSVTSAAMNGIGFAPVGIVEGTWVVVTFTENDMQTPIIMGTIGGIPGKNTLLSEVSDDSYVTPPTQQYVTTGSGGVLTDSSGTPVSAGETVAPNTPTLGSLNKAQYEKLKAGIAKKESGGFANPYQALERSNKHYLGKYQIGGAKLEDYGYIKAGSTKKYGAASVDHADAWLGKEGINSKEDLLNAPATQELLMDRMLTNNMKSIAKQTGTDPSAMEPGKLGGLLYVAHNQGATVAAKYLKSGGAVQGADGNGFTSAAAYNIGYQAITSKINSSGEHPSLANVGDKAAENPDQSARNDNRKYDTTQSDVVKKRAQEKRAKGEAGFNDPTTQYPRITHLNEPDTNRLARGQKIDQTIVKEKEDERIKGVPIANSSVVWQQPYVPYNAEYPYNHVFESESGHVMEFDDTEERERIHLYHTAGTFFEIDANGTKVEKVKGDNVLIVEKDQHVYVIGSGHVFLQGDLSVKVGGQCNIEVTGDAAIKVAGSTFIDTVGEFNLKAGGNINLSSGGTISLHADEDVITKAGADISMLAANVISEASDTIHSRSPTAKSDHAYGESNIDSSAHGKEGSSASDVPLYSPIIEPLVPITRQEVDAVRYENTPEQAAKAAEKDAPPETTAMEDKGAAKEPNVVVSECEFVMPLTPDTQISNNFKLKHLCKDGPFPFEKGQRGLSDTQIACNLKNLCLNIIEPLFAKYAIHGIKINSAFRPNSGKDKVSQHELGCAVDIGFLKIRGNKSAIFDIAMEIKNTIDFDQLLFETTSDGWCWIHISCKKTGNRPSSDTSKVMTYHNHKSIGSGLILKL